MLIVCPSCTTSYQVEPASLGPSGRSVRCARCQNTWFAVAPVVVPGWSDDLDILDEEPRASEPPPRPAEPTADAVDVTEQWEQGAASPVSTAESSALDAEIAVWGAETLERNNSAPQETETPEGAYEAGPETGSTDGIDVAGLSADIDMQHADQTAAADAVLAEVTAPSIVAGQPSFSEQEGSAGLNESDAQAARPDDGRETPRMPARTIKPRRPGRSPPRLPGIIAGLMIANTMLIAWRTDVVRLLPQTAGLYASLGLPVNLRGLAFDNVKMSKELQDGISVLVVEGSVTNVSRRVAELPQLRLAVRNGAHHEIYAWTASLTRSVLEPGETLPFRSRLASPPGEARDVLVRFVGRRDVLAGMR